MARIMAAIITNQPQLDKLREIQKYKLHRSGGSVLKRDRSGHQLSPCLGSKD